MLKRLDDQLIIEAYQKSLTLNLDLEFIALLKDELVERGIFDQAKQDLVIYLEANSIIK
ncbi:sporulation histidine kinase inhibitor Sda [Halalkalibacter kiskunsagensis]|uniref:Sporulation histidine kinase inhibitor Sda n=1 Tax=Halalkalibacter kiskunsagensis TaxID=1548599 RepID=A0ABV6KJ83_9BACI